MTQEDANILNTPSKDFDSNKESKENTDLVKKLVEKKAKTAKNRYDKYVVDAKQAEMNEKHNIENK